MAKKYISCTYCGKKPVWGDNSMIYGVNQGRSYKCYYCKDCNAYVGCHKNSRKPLGTLANKELRELRIKAHQMLDPLWISGKMTRSQAYEMLSVKFGKEIHIGYSDNQQCIKIIGFLNNIGSTC